MRWIVVALGVVIALAIVAAVVGYFIPQTHITARSAVYRAPPGRVWAAIVTVSEYPDWRRSVREVEVLPGVDGRLAWRERATHGTITCQTHEMSPPRRFVVRITDRNRAYGGTWTYELTRDGDGTRLTITERGEIYRPVFRALARHVFGYTGALDSYLSALHERLGSEALLPLDGRIQGA